MNSPRKIIYLYRKIRPRLRSPFLWYVALRQWVIGTRRFETAKWSYLEGSKCPWRMDWAPHPKTTPLRKPKKSQAQDCFLPHPCPFILPFTRYTTAQLKPLLYNLRAASDGSDVTAILGSKCVRGPFKEILLSRLPLAHQWIPSSFLPPYTHYVLYIAQLFLTNRPLNFNSARLLTHLSRNFLNWRSFTGRAT